MPYNPFLGSAAAFFATSAYSTVPAVVLTVNCCCFVLTVAVFPSLLLGVYTDETIGARISLFLNQR